MNSTIMSYSHQIEMIFSLRENQELSWEEKKRRIQGILNKFYAEAVATGKREVLNLVEAKFQDLKTEATATIELLYTIDGDSQFTIQTKYNSGFMKSKEEFVKFAKSQLSEAETKNLVKISCCVYTDETDTMTPPSWYMDCNGKFYFSEGVLEE